MINKLEIDGVHFDIDDDMRSHVEKKIGKLDKYLPSHARKSAHAKVILSESKNKKSEQFCEVVLQVPSQTLTAKEGQSSMYASIDAVESKLKSQIKRYKETHSSTRDRRSIRKLFGKARRR